MLEGLSHIDLSGISGNMNFVYDNANEYISEIICSIGAALFLIIMAIFFVIVYKRIMTGRYGRNTEQYRKVMSDMYVVGMIKKFAKEDSVDILNELKEYNQILKKNSFKHKGIDNAIEEHLSEKIADFGIKKFEKKTNEKDK